MPPGSGSFSLTAASSRDPARRASTILKKIAIFFKIVLTKPVYHNFSLQMWVGRGEFDYFGPGGVANSSNNFKSTGISVMLYFAKEGLRPTLIV